MFSKFEMRLGRVEIEFRFLGYRGWELYEYRCCSGAMALQVAAPPPNCMELISLGSLVEYQFCLDGGVGDCRECLRLSRRLGGRFSVEK